MDLESCYRYIITSPEYLKRIMDEVVVVDRDSLSVSLCEDCNKIVVSDLQPGEYYYEPFCLANIKDWCCLDSVNNKDI
jgi:hypothetical protein